MRFGFTFQLSRRNSTVGRW